MLGTGLPNARLSPSHGAWLLGASWGVWNIGEMGALSLYAQEQRGFSGLRNLPECSALHMTINQIPHPKSKAVRVERINIGCQLLLCQLGDEVRSNGCLSQGQLWPCAPCYLSGPWHLYVQGLFPGLCSGLTESVESSTICGTEYLNPYGPVPESLFCLSIS